MNCSQSVLGGDLTFYILDILLAVKFNENRDTLSVTKLISVVKRRIPLLVLLIFQLASLHEPLRDIGLALFHGDV